MFSILSFSQSAGKSDGDPASTWPELTSPDIRDALAPVFARLDELAELEAGWEPPSAEPISPIALDRARDLLVHAADTLGLDAWYDSAIDVDPIADGGVYIAWRAPNGELELEISPTGALAYSLMQDAGLDRHFEEGALETRDDALRQVRRVVFA
jgi:hypothetical protein